MHLANVTTDIELKESMILRRYVDLPKFLDLLHSRCLYLRRADGFADRLEGALFPGLRASIDAVHARGDSHDNADDFYQKARIGNYVSCWTIEDKDNMALWQLYGGAKTCVAVTTTVGHLMHLALSSNQTAEIRRVNYIDHRHVTDYMIGNYLDVLKYKNEAYGYEKELRLIVPQMGRDWKQNPMGLRLPIISLDSFVQSVVLAPEAEQWFIEALQSLCSKYDLKAPVKQSILATQQT